MPTFLEKLCEENKEYFRGATNQCRAIDLTLSTAQKLKEELHKVMSQIEPEPLSDGDETAYWINYGMQKYEEIIIDSLNELVPTKNDN